MSKNSKFWWFLFIAVLVVTIITDALGGSATGGIDAGIATASGDTDVSILTSLVVTFWNLTTFKIDGFPALLSAIIFLPFWGFTVINIISILKGLIPFTSGS